MTEAVGEKKKHWPIWRLVLIYCVAMNLMRGLVTAVWTTVAMGSSAQFPSILGAYLPSMFTLNALMGGLLAVAAHLLARRVTDSSILTVIAVTLVTTIAQLLVVRSYVQSLNALMFQITAITPFVAIAAVFVVWRESLKAPQQRQQIAQ